ncbi:PREDICTED: putative methylesterase 11, chloroplastic [Nicotiana attenuata]|uniref:Methylesterase 11, chloroplastic n=1 Tax=Nicotiana attenuata TaxID=49451 RepID=A0A1J6JWR7_NICAT|nr:PREDICTED: putative methylesterase 11, chloroplastic [Nicotiana attenuata]OIT21574.1 putative methylesterase 11, chloroplastic [Nicotiana attenuata]
MGNSLACFSQSQAIKRNKTRAKSSQSLPPPYFPGSSASQRSDKIFLKETSIDTDYIKEQARVAAALLLQHHQQNGTLTQFESLRDPLATSKRQKRIPRSSSSSSRPSLLADSLPQHLEIPKQGAEVEELETKHFVLVHGGGFGAWCWYKISTLLKESGYQVDAIDLTGSGAHSLDSNNITTLSEYVKPLTNFLEKLPIGNKVILVGHDIGGACVSYAMELHRSKISKVVFIAAAMLMNEQSILDMFSMQLGSDNVCQRAQMFLYANGKNHPPTAIDFDKSLLKDVLFNQTPAKDVELASVLMRPIPFAPLTEKLSLSATNYGSIPRFYVKTLEDFAIPVSLQEAMIDSSPPEHVFQIKGSDHSPFLSKPQALHKILVEISRFPLK